MIHAMEAHHFDVEFRTLEAVLVQAADATSAARPGARRKSWKIMLRDWSDWKSWQLRFPECPKPSPSKRVEKSASSSRVARFPMNRLFG